MPSAPDLQLQLEHLRQRHAALQQTYRELQIQLDQQSDSAARWVEWRTQELRAEASEQKKAETLQKVFYRIAERAAAGLPFYEFLQSVHTLLGELIYAKNFYVCLYHAQKHTLDFPYYVDERDGDTMQCNDVPYRRGLTEYVLRTASPQLIDSARLKILEAGGDVTEATGDLTFSTWLGVPMQMGGCVGGILAVQSYEPDIRHSLADADILLFVANHFSSAIERYQAIDALRKTEERYRTVIEQVGVGVAVLQDECVAFANPALVRMVGHTMDALLGRPLAHLFHPDDAAIFSTRPQDHPGEPGQRHFDEIRVLTQTREIRSLEFSSAPIEWEQRDARLLFVVDATARREAEQAQRAILARQTELNNLQSRFISMASHEFRTPLAAIKSSVDLLQHYSDRLPVERKRQTLDTIDEAVQRMTHMLENVLLLGRTEAGQLDFHPTEVAVTPLFLSLLEDLMASMSQRHADVRMVLDLPPSTQTFWLDETLMRHIVGNLLSNAFKYSPQGGEVRLAVKNILLDSDGAALAITIADQGIGIPASDLPDLFESFHRASNVGSIAGTGLGLSIVKDAVRCHHGSIEVDSQLGKGTCFTVTLPTVAPTMPLHPTP